MKASRKLIGELNPNGYWSGELSSSALSTATALFAIYIADKKKNHTVIKKSLHWLANNANPDGGWGDTIDSESNLSTTLLAWSALSIAKELGEDYQQIEDNAEKWISSKIKTENDNNNAKTNLDPANIANAVFEYYGNDKTFSAPILLMCTIAGRLGKDGWKYIPQLPFELSVLPHTLFRVIKLPVVSYAMPALISIGIAKFANSQNTFSPMRLIRKLLIKNTLKTLNSIQPKNGGFLEAIPLTSFVLMSLTSANLASPLACYANISVSEKSLKFLIASIRNDGSWPIDSNLATWLTALSVKALDMKDLTIEQKNSIRSWLLNQQFTKKHPFTKAAPGGWGWTDLPGSTPDADDTSAVLLALKKLDNKTPEIKIATSRAIKWILDLQNSDGGIPTFCKGWGTLPFDRSCPDITAHAINALTVWQTVQDKKLSRKIDRSVLKSLQYLKNRQQPDGSWIPLWFGNQTRVDKQNPIYGTSQVIIALGEYIKIKQISEIATVMLHAGCKFLRTTQIKNIPIEELSLLSTALSYSNAPEDCELSKKTALLISKETKFIPSPIGLYFASLWYSEKLYPIIFATLAEKTH